ncbi:hypothetical protein BDZ89DRAFT_314733 [Hymenopellis radicata]|nr:hypothetical protein BDZ89DRAFT_314733 [Hymenopellis radicata]
MLSTFVFFALLRYLASAQQYAGTVVPLPEFLPDSVTGAETAYFNIKDANGSNTTLVNYFSLPNGTRQDTNKVQRAVIHIHGANGNYGGAPEYFDALYAGVNKASEINPNVNQNTVALMAPYFVSDTRNLVRSNIMFWPGTTWYTGATSIYPPGANISSYDVLDQILQYFNDITLYPNMKQIVVSGHSMGAQMAHRYAAVGKDLGLHVPVVYWLGNPSSFLWLDATRPFATDTCPTYNDWGHGLDNYSNDYEKDFVDAVGAAGVRLRYQSRLIAYARGLNDFGDYSEGECAPYTTGGNRGERMYNFLDAFPIDAGDTTDFMAGVGHNGLDMATSDSGLYRLFLDNFDGDGVRHPSIGERGPPTN